MHVDEIEKRIEKVLTEKDDIEFEIMEFEDKLLVLKEKVDILEESEMRLCKKLDEYLDKSGK